jgi:hypothetical protein
MITVVDPFPGGGDPLARGDRRGVTDHGYEVGGAATMGVRWRWLKSLKRRSQRAFMSWEKFTSITDRFFPSIRILHPLPCHRFDARTRKGPVR